MAITSYEPEIEARAGRAKRNAARYINLNLTTVSEWLADLVGSEVFAREEESGESLKQSVVSALICAGHTVLSQGPEVDYALRVTREVNAVEGIPLSRRAKLHSIQKYSPSLPRRVDNAIDERLLRYHLKIQQGVYMECCAAVGNLNLEHKNTYFQYCLVAGLSLSSYLDPQDIRQLELQIADWREGLRYNTMAVEATLAGFVEDRDRGRGQGHDLDS